MKLILGLGNPGKEYQETRHNIGFKIVDKIAQLLEIEFKKDSLAKSFLAKDYKKDILLAKPFTFMNLSGDALRELSKNYKIELGDLLVVHDDLDLDFARLKFSFGLSSAGHRGIESIIDSVGSKEFSRLRFGIGRGQAEDASKFVLSRFNKDELLNLEDAINGAEKASLFWIEFGIKKAMERYN